MDISTIIAIVSSLGGGSALTVLIQWLINRKKNKIAIKNDIIDVTQKQIDILNNSNAKLNETIEKLYEYVCYLPNCSMRVNGLQDNTASDHADTNRKGHNSKRKKG